jgi:hypothetical protein
MNTFVHDTLLALAALAVLQIGITGVRAETLAPTNRPAIEEIIVIAPAPATAESAPAQPRG